MFPSFRPVAQAFLAVIAISTFPAAAHEFWLLPEDFTVDPGTELIVGLRNGQMMQGISLSYLPASIARFETTIATTTTPVIARLGDQRLTALTDPLAGLAIVLHETTDSKLTYTEFEKFQKFVTHKGFTDVLVQHAARGLPDTGFTESYRRYAKTLIAVGDGAGADQAMGLRIEIVALANPYTDDLTTGLPLQVLRDGQPLPGAQVELFATSADGTVTQAFHTTDPAGVALVPAQPGITYLADTVDIYALPNDDPATGPVWHSDWASLTYMVP